MLVSRKIALLQENFRDFTCSPENTGYSSCTVLDELKTGYFLFPAVYMETIYGSSEWEFDKDNREIIYVLTMLSLSLNKTIHVNESNSRCVNGVNLLKGDLFLSLLFSFLICRTNRKYFDAVCENFMELQYAFFALQLEPPEDTGNCKDLVYEKLSGLTVFFINQKSGGQQPNAKTVFQYASYLDDDIFSAGDIEKYLTGNER